MKATFGSIVLAAWAGSALAQKIDTSEFDATFLTAQVATNAIGMEELRGRKESQRAEDLAAGVFDEDRYTALATGTSCVNGKAGEYSCNKVDLKGFLRHQDMGSRTRVGNDVWGEFFLLSTSIIFCNKFQSL